MPYTHGLSGKNKRLYKIWKEMRYRCSNPKNKSYERYGGRGISVCDAWNNDFASFYKWAMLNGYKEDIDESGRNKLSIDRINNNGNYEPSNCRWATDIIQANNTRKSLKPEERFVPCPICGKIYRKINRNTPKTCSNGCSKVLMSIQKTSNKNYSKVCPVCGKEFWAKRSGHYKSAVCCSRNCAKKKLSDIWKFNGESHSVTEWAEIVGVNAHCLHHRIEIGWSIEDTLTTPLRGRRHAKELQKNICD